MSWMRPSLNHRFVNLFRQYHDVIVATIFGHEHTDAFRVVYHNGKSPRVLFVNLFVNFAIGSFFFVFCVFHCSWLSVSVQLIASENMSPK